MPVSIGLSGQVQATQDTFSAAEFGLEEAKVHAVLNQFSNHLEELPNTVRRYRLLNQDINYQPCLMEFGLEEAQVHVVLNQVTKHLARP